MTTHLASYNNIPISLSNTEDASSLQVAQADIVGNKILLKRNGAVQSVKRAVFY